jgi:hypothetical protein
MSQSLLSVGVFVIVVAYLAAIIYLTNYLRRFHPATWVALERPGLRNPAEHAKDPWPFVRSGFLMLIFVFNGAHQSLGDRRLNYLVWVIRTLLAAAVVLVPLTAMVQP